MTWSSNGVHALPCEASYAKSVLAGVEEAGEKHVSDIEGFW